MRPPPSRPRLRPRPTSTTWSASTTPRWTARTTVVDSPTGTASTSSGSGCSGCATSDAAGWAILLTVNAGRFELGTDGPKTLVVGVDGSTTSLRAGAYAAGLARRQGAHLVI